ncbi:DUF896 domain-containing protein [Paenibacillus solisilvae]|uniref:UPF0291 protein ACFPYJ_01465 n=1 Tax=Paenibacillus solisilvae TaxID=2486751 RepID=A0ABW0VPJ1_9BACL
MRALLQRINELSKQAKAEGLSQAELEEQDSLRKKYVEIFRGSLESTLLNVTIYDPNGDDVTPEKLRQHQARLAADEPDLGG